MAKDKLLAAARKVAAAQPATASALITLIKNMVVPILSEALISILAKGTNKTKFAKYLVPARDVLIEAYPLEEE